MIDQLVNYDTELFLFLNGLGTPTWDGFWLFITNKYYAIPLYAFLLVLILKTHKKKEIFFTLLLVAVLITITDQTANLFKKTLFLRLRPCQTDLIDYMRLVKDGCGGRYGYFSGHASNAMALATFIGLVLRNHYKYLIFIILFWAALVGYSRIYIGVHYPGDVFTGMIVGGIYGGMIFKFREFLIKKYAQN
ncbi:phosphatase PAP2 family protein [uncultured Kordia sp.]|uniref:phosphatase PAP2 family protein n=1 Tax=uncultured Kordia sp. TaxID=507699 RepID=UPI00260D9F7F|nr:phosphatase PAP2 family protein [uncultured Kordia sp.]